MSDIDGATVTWGKNTSWKGEVLSDSYIPGFVRVKWAEPQQFTDMARVEDLVVMVDDQPTASS